MKCFALLFLLAFNLAVHAEQDQWTDEGCHEVAKAIEPSISPPEDEDKFVRAFILADQCGNIPDGEAALERCLAQIKAEYAKHCSRFSGLQ